MNHKNNTKELHILGDPLIDHWIEFEEDVYFHGGAANVYENCKRILRNTASNVKAFFINPFDNRESIPVKKYVYDFNGTTYQYYDDLSYPLTCKDSKINPYLYEDFGKINYLGLIVSDYNKGFINRCIEEYKDKFYDYDFIIIDSRYGNTNFSFFRDHTDLLIKRTTKNVDKEVNFDFDFEITTNGPGPVSYLHGNKGSIYLPSEVKSSRSTCGAGDVFTSALGSWLIDSERFSEIEQRLQTAISFAFDASQEAVSSSQYTCNTNIIKL